MSGRAHLGWLDVAEKGSELGMRLLVWLCTALGRGAGRLVLRPIALYYVLFHAAARRASRDYLIRLDGDASFGRVYRHVLCFATVALDRMFMAQRKRGVFEMKDCGMDLVRRLGKERRGAILLGAHLGSFEAMRMEGDMDALTINIVVDFKNARRISAMLKQLDPRFTARVIGVDEDDMGFVLRIKECIERGELVAILGDRVHPRGATAMVRFLGADAPFPVGAYQVAALLGCPIYLTFGLFREPNRYEVHCELFAEKVTLPRAARKEALRDYAQRFATRLESFTRSAPDNWFNFYDFWRGQASL